MGVAYYSPLQNVEIYMPHNKLTSTFGRYLVHEMEVQNKTWNTVAVIPKYLSCTPCHVYNTTITGVFMAPPSFGACGNNILFLPILHNNQ